MNPGGFHVNLTIRNARRLNARIPRTGPGQGCREDAGPNSQLDPLSPLGCRIQYLFVVFSRISPRIYWLNSYNYNSKYHQPQFALAPTRAGLNESWALSIKVAGVDAASPHIVTGSWLLLRCTLVCLHCISHVKINWSFDETRFGIVKKS